MSVTSSNLDSNIKKCIRENLTCQGYTGADFDVAAGSVKGDNYLGIIHKITVRMDGENGKKHSFHWIAKCASENEEFRKIVRLRNVYIREIFVYQNMFVEYAKLQEECGISDRFTSYPKLLSVSEDIPETIIMEDMKSIGYVMKNRVEPLDWNHVKLVMEEYGRLHALSFALREKRPEVFKRFKEEMKDTFFSEMDKGVMEQSNKFKTDKIEKILQQEDPTVLEKFKEYCDVDVLSLLKPEFADEYSVFCHGDSWVNNMLFKYEENPAIPSDICFLDFQLSRFGSPAFDLSYFIYTCTDQKLRDDKFEEMLETYHKSFVDFLAKFSCEGETLFPYAQLHDQMRRFATFGLMMSSMVLHLMLSEQDEIPDFSGVQSDDWSEYNFVSGNEHIYLKKMQDIVLDFIDRKYI